MNTVVLQRALKKDLRALCAKWINILVCCLPPLIANSPKKEKLNQGQILKS